MNIHFIVSALLFMTTGSTYTITMMRHAHNAYKQKALTRLSDIKKHLHQTKSIDLAKQATLTGITLTAQGIGSAVISTVGGTLGLIVGALSGAATGATVATIDFHLIKATTDKERFDKISAIGLAGGAIMGCTSGYALGACLGAAGPRGLILAPLTTALILYRANHVSKKREQEKPEKKQDSQ